MRDFIFAIKSDLELKKPIDIRLSTRKSKLDGLYDPQYSDSGRLKSHLITIWLDIDNSRDIETLIAHELIHAWQEENKCEDIHGKPFQDWADYLSLKYNLPDIYLPDVDE